MKIIFATGNAHKLSEAQKARGKAFELTMPKQVGLEGEIPETGDTLEKNSAEKAHYIWSLKHETCFADDTGLEVDLLNGEPGVYTARYCSLPATFSDWDNTQTFESATEANMQKLLAEMDAAGNSFAKKNSSATDVSAASASTADKEAVESNRKARFRTVVTLIKDGVEHRFEGVLEGRIATERCGHEGFGYDPVFIPNGYDCTLAELPMEEKNAISHRGQAMRALAEFLKKNAE